MTILDQITHEAKALSTKERREALQLIRSLRSRTAGKAKAAKASSKTAIDKKKLHPALRAITGMWKDRTDLPKESAAASKVLRRRLMGRDTNA